MVGWKQFWDGVTRAGRRAGVNPQFIRFLAVGVLNTLFGQGFFAILVLLGLHPQVALLLATIVGVLFNFQSFGRLVFRGSDGRLPRFIACYTLVYAINAIALDVLIRFGIWAILAQAILMLPIATLNFALSRRFVFTGPSAAPKDS